MKMVASVLHHMVTRRVGLKLEANPDNQRKLERHRRIDPVGEKSLIFDPNHPNHENQTRDPMNVFYGLWELDQMDEIFEDNSIW